jgi:hypothetical protein
MVFKCPGGIVSEAMPLEKYWHYSRVFIKIRAACSYLAQEIKQTYNLSVEKSELSMKNLRRREFIKRKKKLHGIK